MAVTNRTSELRDAIRQKTRIMPESKRRKVDQRTRGERESQDAALDKQYIPEAYVVLNHINTLTRMLGNVRKAYLNMESRNTSLGRPSARNLDLGSLTGEQSWAGIRYLTNEERDQIDFQARDILRRCADRVKEMEMLEKRKLVGRGEIVAGRTNPLARLLPSRLRQDASTLASDFLAAHHSSITWFLNRRLAEASQSQKEMQEERVKRQLERTRSLGSGATWEAANIAARGGVAFETDEVDKASSSGSWLGEASTNFIAATIGAPSPRTPAPPVTADIILPSDDEDDDLELSASQIMQFEEENAHILASAQETLESVQQAESRLLDISALQMELVNHLTQQTELTDQLYEDVIATASTVEKGNVQLKEAQRRAKDSRMFILLFFIGASLSLLFLHYY